MRRHELDVVSLAWGALFVGVAVFALVASTGRVHLADNGRWVLPFVLITLGGVGLLTSLSHLGRRAAPPRSADDSGAGEDGTPFDVEGDTVVLPRP